MLQLRKYRQTLTHFISSDRGQQIFNFAYSIGAAIVIWGALFKILHIKGGDVLLAIGMGTEVVMFILTAFDRPQSYATAVATTANAPAAVDAGNAPDMANACNATATATMPAMAQPSAPSIDPEIIDSHASAFTEQMQQMQELSKNLLGLNAIYEIQLKTASGQLESFDRVNKGIKDMRDMYERCAVLSAQYCIEAEKMVQNMATLNKVYENMVAAMTVNMNPMAHNNGIQR